jgi:lipoyl-dependent peroxiredoxin
MKRSATAVWSGTGKDGTGTLSTGSGALQEQPYSAHGRFEAADGRAGTNPEELIAVAHAGCFSMALSFRLAGAGHPPEELRTEAALAMVKEESGWSITDIHLKVTGKVPGIEADDFQEHADEARRTCPVSRVLRADITMEATLEK